MSAPEPSIQQSRVGEPDIRFFFWSKIVDKSASVLSLTIKYGAWIVIAYFAEQVLISFAGKTTHATVALSLLAEFDKFRFIPWVVAALCLIYATRERKERLRKTEKLSSRIRDLETRLNPSRSSSNLAPTGETHERDKP